MDNRVYYGEYSLQHWIDLILKKNIVLPEYQRYFVWDEKKVATLIETFKKKEFVPPITIGAFKEGGVTQNLILDGQLRWSNKSGHKIKLNLCSHGKEKQQTASSEV